MKVITVRDGSQYFYTTATFNAANPLGIVKATLVEYALFNNGNTGDPVCKLYKTNDGNWYDLPSENALNATQTVSLKRAIDETEMVKAASEK